VTELILHHFDLSPFAEKIRKVFGIKGLSWTSVQIPMIMPKPDLMALTGGYRKTPVLQIGADIYCDTALIIDVLESLYPDPPLFKSGRLTNYAYQSWSDASIFPTSAALSLHENAENLPVPLVEDRRDYFSFLDFDNFKEDAPHFRAQFRAGAKLLNDQLACGSDFLLGDTPEWADVNAYFNIWTAHGNIPSSVRMMDDLPALARWYDRVCEFGDGTRTEMDAKQAVKIAHAATPIMPAPIARADESGIDIGTLVTVAPTDHGKVSVAGQLTALTDKQITITRQDENAGDVTVHFPRVGYKIDKLNGGEYV